MVSPVLEGLEQNCLLLLITYQYCKVFNGIWPSGSEFTMKPGGFTMGPGRFTMEPGRFTMEPGELLSNIKHSK